MLGKLASAINKAAKRTASVGRRVGLLKARDKKDQAVVSK